MTSSGVLHVYKTFDERYKKGFSWIYDNNRNSYHATTLLKLEQRIKSLNLPWIVKDDETYERVISSEWEDDEFNILDFYN